MTCQSFALESGLCRVLGGRTRRWLCEREGSGTFSPCRALPSVFSVRCQVGSPGSRALFIDSGGSGARKVKVTCNLSSGFYSSFFSPTAKRTPVSDLPKTVCPLRRAECGGDLYLGDTPGLGVGSLCYRPVSVTRQGLLRTSIFGRWRGYSCRVRPPVRVRGRVGGLENHRPVRLSDMGPTLGGTETRSETRWNLFRAG